MSPSTLPIAAVLLHLTTTAAGHGHDSTMDMGTMKPNSTAPAHSSFIAHDVWTIASYAGLGEHLSSLVAHVVLMALAWLFILPTGKFAARRVRCAD